MPDSRSGRLGCSSSNPEQLGLSLGQASQVGPLEDHLAVRQFCFGFFAKTQNRTRGTMLVFTHN